MIVEGKESIAMYEDDENSAKVKTRGRKPKSDIEPDEAAQAMDLMAQKQHEAELSVQEVDGKFLEDGETYNLHIALSRAKAAQEQMASGMLTLGAQLILIKKHEEHGQFIAALEKLNIPQSTARYAMMAANKFGNRQLTDGLGNEKIRALTVLDDESIKTLEAGGDYAGMTLDDIERMTVRELKENLRKERADRAAEKEAAEKRLKAIESVVKSKEEKLTELELEAAHKVPPTKEQIAQNELERFSMDFFQPINLLNKAFADAIFTLDRVMQIPNITKAQLDTFVQKYAEDVKLLGGLYTGFEETVNNLFPHGE